MENNKTLYTTFTKLAIKVAIVNDYTLSAAKKLVAKKFQNHPYEELILKSIKTDEFNKETLIKLANICLNVCEEFGPDRDYITLVLVLESINQESLPKEIKKDISSPIVQHFREEIVKINKGITQRGIFFFYKFTSIMFYFTHFWKSLTKSSQKIESFICFIFDLECFLK